MTGKKTTDSWKYLAISPLDEQWGLVCTTVGYQNVAPRSRYPVSQHPTDYNPILSGRVLNEYQLVYIVEGSGFFTSTSVSRSRIEAGTVMMLFPGEWHTYGPDNDTGWSELWVGFKGAIADGIANGGFFSPGEPLYKIGISETIVALYRDIIDNATQQLSGHQQLIAGAVQHILGLVHYKRQNRSHADSSVIDRINRALIIMRDNTAQEISTEELAAEVGMGYTWFRRAFRDNMGVSPGQYRLQLKLVKAKELLASSDMSLSEIAYELGFESISQFSTFFKKREGITASLFRSKNAMTYK